MARSCEPGILRSFGEGDLDETFLPLRPPVRGEPIRVLHDWTCPFCGAYNWAEVIFIEGKIESIAVPFDVASVARAHFISERIAEYYESVTGKAAIPSLRWPLHASNPGAARAPGLNRLVPGRAPA